MYFLHNKNEYIATFKLKLSLFGGFRAVEGSQVSGSF